MKDRATGIRHEPGTAQEVARHLAQRIVEGGGVRYEGVHFPEVPLDHEIARHFSHIEALQARLGEPKINAPENSEKKAALMAELRFHLAVARELRRERRAASARIKALESEIAQLQAEARRRASLGGEDNSGQIVGKIAELDRLRMALGLPGARVGLDLHA
ncbi:MAG: hypothetical protein HY394_05380 [Candidatus Diapherotrites archaeon]|nr:hypothetical protein [Candidatus Diapherotrites archaeon]